MSKLLISKSTEAKVLSTIWSMGAESLSPHDYVNLERILKQLSVTRSVPLELIGIEHSMISGKKDHDSDCNVYNAHCCPEPCNCK